jgi:hypothetical protein
LNDNYTATLILRQNASSTVSWTSFFINHRWRRYRQDLSSPTLHLIYFPYHFHPYYTQRPLRVPSSIMSGSTADFSMSTLSLNSTGSQNEDWDRSESDIQPNNQLSNHRPLTTPRNSVIFPADGAEKTPGRGTASKDERTLSELLKLHAEKGAGGSFSADEVSRVAEVLGQWVCAHVK